MVQNHHILGQKLLFLLLFGLLSVQKGFAQPAPPITAPPVLFIDSLSYEGLKVTRKSLILRELQYQIGDTFPAERLNEVLEANRLRILNLGIFAHAEVWPGRITPDGRVVMHLKVNEMWYWIPSPVFELIDRNFNVWWKEFDRSLQRTNYGLDYTQYNFTGHADQINLTATSGYNERFNARYRTPWLNRDGTLGLSLGAGFSRTHEAPIRTINNKIDFRRDPDKYLIQRFFADAQLSWRPGLNTTHSFAVEYRDNRVNDTIPNFLNSDYFLDGKSRQRHSSIVYLFNYDTRNIRPYPTSGWNIWLELRQNGLTRREDLNLARFKLDVAKYTQITPRWSLETIGRFRTSLPRTKPPYHNNQGLGYLGDVVRGYEYYVMDGLDFTVIRTSLTYKCFRTMVHFPKKWSKKIPRLRPFEVRTYLSANNDFGYANDPFYAAQNPLTNRPLYGYGLGLDVVMFYNRLFSIYWMRTDLGEHGFFIRTRL
jgi:Omp85 superfamily domain/Surface antigen variable number repeat